MTKIFIISYWQMQGGSVSQYNLDVINSRVPFTSSSRVLIPIPKMSKQERRHLFALKVAQKDEEERQRRQQQELWRQHEDQCMALGVDPNLTAFNNAQTGYPFYFNPASGTWQPYPVPGR